MSPVVPPARNDHVHNRHVWLSDGRFRRRFVAIRKVKIRKSEVNVVDYETETGFMAEMNYQAWQAWALRSHVIGRWMGDV